MHAKFDHSIFSHSGDMIGAHQNYKNTSGDEIANVNLFTTISHTYSEIQKRKYFV